MAELFKMPMLGQTMEEGTILQWFKQEGDTVKQGEALLEVMSDKANFEVEAPVSGVVRKILAPADATVPVHEAIVVIAGADEPIDALLAGAGAPEAAPEPTAPAAAVAGPVPVAVTAPAPVEASGPVAISPRARRLADQHGVAVSALAGCGSGPGGRVIERDVEAYVKRAASAPAGDAVRTRTTPLAAKVAEDLGVALGAVAASDGVRVHADDVRRAAGAVAEKPAAQKPAAKATGTSEIAVAEVIPFRGLRKMSADTVTRSRQTAPHVCINMEVDMTEAVALHGRLQPEVLKAYNTKLTYTDLLVKAVALALSEHPLCNAALVGDEIRLYADRNIGVAVAAEAGLIVPVIRHADQKSLSAISLELKALVERCRGGKQTQADITGGTFTITNLGVFGIDSFDPIIVPPQSCILGVCRIGDKPVVVEKEVVVRPMMNLCLSFDHRVLDGVPAARFLKRLKELLESPLLLLV